jgi:hypothetical protein
MFRKILKQFTWHPVKFSDGNYGARKLTVLGYTYMDLTENNRSNHTGKVSTWQLGDSMNGYIRVRTLTQVLAKIDEENAYKHVNSAHDKGTMLTDKEVTFNVLKD